MSYARFSEGDVYVFVSSEGIECCGCWLQQREWVDDESRPWTKGYYREIGDKVQQVYPDNAGMIAHLETHIAAGHDVPDYCMERLRDPQDAADNAYYFANGRWPEVAS